MVRVHGYQVKLTDSVWASDDYVAGPPAQRVADMHSLFQDDDVDVMHCLWGGVGAIEMLPLIDYDLIAAHPKALMGYSDITNLHAALAEELRIGDLSWTRLWVVWRSRPRAVHASTLRSRRSPKGDWVWFRRSRTTIGFAALLRGRVTAPIVGGNLYTLNHLMGTPWQLDLDGTILMIEEVDTMAIHFDVMFWQMRLAGLLRQVAGVVVSELEGCGKPDPEVVRDRSLEDVLEEHLGGLGVPVIYGHPLGHGTHLASIPLGCRGNSGRRQTHSDHQRAGSPRLRDRVRFGCSRSVA